MTRPKRSDEQLVLDVLGELAWDMRVDPAAIDVQTREGVVTLRGEVDSWAALQAAEEAAHRVAGVLDVANDLTVSLRGLNGLTDGETAQAVRHGSPNRR
jgi:osmotically-inducible protein OsmY